MHAPSFTGATWVAAEPESSTVERLRSSGLSGVAARCAAIRWGDLDDVDSWRTPTLEHLEDPYRMHGMPSAVDRLRRAVADREKVRIITDYDVDGTTSSLILQATLAILGTQSVDYHIPNRFAEGYGFSVVAADAAADDGVGLVVTADIGVRDHAAIARARERGVDVMVCDHHLPRGSAVPTEAIVLCPPQEGCDYPNDALAACGISLKLAEALLRDHRRRDDIVRSFLKLAAVGTVADMVPLTTQENRAIVALGLSELNQGPHHAGLAALLETCDLRGGHIGEGDLGFRVGPRINAAGRMADASLVVELLNCRDPARARNLAARIEHHNHERRAVQTRLVSEALERVEAGVEPFVVLGGPEEEGWHRGVVGIVAARVKDEVHRPVAVVSIQGDRAVGSIRSVPGIHAVHALDSVDDLLLKYGGHPAAAGFTVPTEHLGALKERLALFAQQHTEALGAVREIDAEIEASSLHRRLHDELASLGPFGMGNPKPRLMVRGVDIPDVRLLGKAQKMVAFGLPRPGLEPLDAVWWDQAKHVASLGDGPVDLLGTLSINRWRGTSRLQFRLEDARPSRR